jgi:dTDP-4-dehydrorhamnose 3,5-epimerase
MIDLPVLGDERGSLVAIEPGELLPFSIGRVSYVFATTPGAGQEFHAHRNSRQWVIAVSGSCTILVDDGQRRAEVRLERADRALEVGAMVWRQVHEFSGDAVLIVLAEEAGAGDNSIRSYDEFRAALRAN